MNNPFEFNQNRDTHTEDESRQLKIRTGVLMALFCCVVLSFVWVLVQVQLVDGSSYLETANYTTAQSETVDSVRGEILDRYGRLLVSNTFGYKVTLDTSVMGENQNAILTELLALCQEEGVEWTDSLPITGSPPYSFTRSEVYTYTSTQTDVDDQGGEIQTSTELRTNLGSLAVKCKWIDDPLAENPKDDAVTYLSAQELMIKMCKTFGVELPKAEGDGQPEISAETRQLLGVLYELALRSKGVLNTEYQFTSNVDITFISKVKEHSLTGVTIETSASRQYNTSYAAHVLGWTGSILPDAWPSYKELGYPMNAIVGRDGAELAFESYLHGSSGVREIETDDNGKIITQNWLTEPQPGGNVVLTLDIALQATTEDLLAQFMSGLDEPAGAAAVVMDMTGGVLSMASYPTYDLSSFRTNYSELVGDTTYRPLLNRATMGLYAPGSTFKMVTAIAGLTEGVITATSTVRCPGYYSWAESTYKCWIYPGSHGIENVTKAITDSCNVFFYDTGRLVGIESLVQYATKFGLGQYTGIEIAEYKGRVAGPETSAALGKVWYGGEVTSAAIGQSDNQFTPIQLANYVATLVNGGNHYEAHLLKEVKSNDYSQTVYEYEPVLKDTIDIDPAHLDAVKLGMYNLSKTASMSKYFADLPVEVGCKTGTAEVAQSESNAVFVCFAPYDDPQIVICLVAEKGASGGNLASIAAGIFAQYFSTDSSLNDVPGENTLLH